MSDWNDAIEACVDCVAENEPENILVIVKAIRALRRPEAKAIACAIPHCITMASCEKAGTCLAEENRPTPRKNYDGADI